MSYCREHSTNNCIECALREQTQVLVLELRAIARLLEPENVEGIVDQTVTPSIAAPPRCPARRKPTLWERFVHRTSEEDLRCVQHEVISLNSEWCLVHNSRDGKRWVG